MEYSFESVEMPNIWLVLDAYVNTIYARICWKMIGECVQNMHIYIELGRCGIGYSVVVNGRYHSSDYTSSSNVCMCIVHDVGGGSRTRTFA